MYMGMVSILDGLNIFLFPPTLKATYMRYGFSSLSGWGDVWNCKIMVSPGSKVKQWPWTLLLTNLLVFIKTTLVTINFLGLYLICRKKVKVSPRSSFEHCWQNSGTQCYIPSSKGHRSIGSAEEDFESFFYHLRAWRPSWSCNPTHLFKFSFSFIHKLHMKFGSKWQQFLTKTCFDFENWVTFGQG